MANFAEQLDLIRIMYYGDPGKGKTVDLAHMAKLGPIIFVDAERRLKAGPLRRLGVPLENIDHRTNVSYEMLIALADEIEERLAGGKKPLVGLCWDSATETGATLLGARVDDGVQRANRAGKERNAWSTEIQDYGDMTQQMRRVIRRFRDLPIHLAISCLATRDTDENGEVRVAPSLTPAVLRDYAGYMDLIFHCRVELVNDTEEYSALTRPFGRWDAKDSFGVFPRYLVNPTFDRVVDYVNGKLTSDKDPIQEAARRARNADASPKTEPTKA